MATFSLSGKGTQAISSPASVTVTVTTTPVTATQGQGNPPNLFGVALLTPGDASGFYAAIPVSQSPQHIPLPAGCTQLGYACINGAQLSVSEVLPAVPNWQKQPWDRNPTPLTLTFLQNVSSGGGQLQGWTYTVPSARILWLTSARVAIQRFVAPTSPYYDYALITSSYGQICYVGYSGTAIGQWQEDAMNGSGMFFTAGSVLTANYSNSDNGGQITVDIEANGTLFDA